MTTRLTLVQQVRRLIDERDTDNSHFDDDPELYDYINQAIRYLGVDVEWPLQTAQATTVEDQAVYTLPTDFVSLIDVYFDNMELTVIERHELAMISLTWQDTPSGKPRYCYKSDNRKMGLYPKPDSDNADLTIQIQYIKVPADLEDDTTAPDLHLSFYDCLPFYAAFLCEKSLGNLKAADHNLNLYEMHKKRLTAKVQNFSDDTFRFKWNPRRYG